VDFRADFRRVETVLLAQPQARATAPAAPARSRLDAQSPGPRTGRLLAVVTWRVGLGRRVGPGQRVLRVEAIPVARRRAALGGARTSSARARRLDVGHRLTDHADLTGDRGAVISLRGPTPGRALLARGISLIRKSSYGMPDLGARSAEGPIPAPWPWRRIEWLAESIGCSQT
jgi:hypothetical protein